MNLAFPAISNTSVEAVARVIAKTFCERGEAGWEAFIPEARVALEAVSARCSNPARQEREQCIEELRELQAEHANDEGELYILAQAIKRLSARATAQGAGAQPVADPTKTDWCQCCGRGWSWVDGNTHRRAVEAAASPDASRAEVEAARREERERCAKVAEEKAAQSAAQVEENNDWSLRSGNSASTANAMCAHAVYVSRNIASAIRALGDRP